MFDNSQLCVIAVRAALAAYTRSVFAGTVN